MLLKLKEKLQMLFKNQKFSGTAKGYYSVCWRLGTRKHTNQDKKIGLGTRPV